MQVKMMNEHKTPTRSEELSALADGELDRVDVVRWMATPAAADADLAGTWATYHVIGDVLRGSDAALEHRGSGFLQRLQVRLQAEESLAPTRLQAVPDAMPAARHAEPANDANFRWKLVAGLASVSALAVLTWGMVGGGAGPSAVSQQLAVAAPAAAVSAQMFEQPVRLPGGEEQVMIRDARLDELLAQHRQGGTTALSMPAGVLRSATFAAPER